MDIPKCYAYNTDGLRSMQIAGHDGEHSHAITWTDDECWSPGPSVTIRGGGGGGGGSEPPSTEPIPCVVCNHSNAKHTPEGCVGRNQEGDECGCFEFI